MTTQLFKAALTALALAASVSASAATDNRLNFASGSINGLQWTAQSLLTGFSGTGTSTTAGNAAYLPSFPGNGGVVGLLMQ